jgi:hypothetical protein
MPFPLPSNTICDLYRAGTGPPTPPVAVGVALVLKPRYRNIKPPTAPPTNITYTHIAYVALGTDVRDGWPNSSGGDVIYIPTFNDPHYQDYTVMFVERVWFGTDRGRDYKAVYLRMNDQPPHESDNC